MVVSIQAKQAHCSHIAGFDNCLFPFYTKVARGNNELFTAVHSLFSFVGGFAILSVGPIGAGILRQSPALDASSYAIGKYQVSSFLEVLRQHLRTDSILSYMQGGFV